MKFLLAFSLLLPLPALAQSNPGDKLPPANPLPYEDAEAAAVMAPIDALFAALTARDGQAVLGVVRPEGGGTAVVERGDGTRAVRRIAWSDYAAGLKPGPEKLEERIAMPAIEVDGDIAMVWAPYVFRVNGKVVHCGTDHFDLVRENGTWKILNVTWTQRTTGCPAS